MRELYEVRDGTVKLSGNQCFLINKATVEIDGKRIFWWKVYFCGGRMSGKDFVAHAPTKEDAMFQLEAIKKSRFAARKFWNDEDFDASKQRKKEVKYRFKELLNELLTLLPELEIE